MSVVDASLMIGAFVFLCLVIAVLAGIVYWLNRKEYRNKGVIATFMNYPNTPLPAVAEYDPNQDLMQDGLRVLDGYPGEPLPEQVTDLFDNLEVFHAFNQRLLKSGRNLVSWDDFRKFAGDRKVENTDESYKMFLEAVAYF